LEAFELGKKEIGAFAFKIVPLEDLSLNKLNNALDRLMQLKSLLKPRILKACAAILWLIEDQQEKGLSCLEQYRATWTALFHLSINNP